MLLLTSNTPRGSPSHRGSLNPTDPQAGQFGRFRNDVLLGGVEEKGNPNGKRVLEQPLGNVVFHIVATTSETSMSILKLAMINCILQ